MIQMVTASPLDDATASVPPGRWAVGVSGGADSVALLLLLRRRADLSLTVAHLNHETRGAASDGDEAFVVELCRRLGVPVVTRRLGDLSLTGLPNNPSARYRGARFALFREVVRREELSGILLAHHADDAAETTLQRLLRGGGVRGFAALRPRATVAGLLVLRPLLRVRRDELREFLKGQGQAWREDASNASPRYQRNRVRLLLSEHPQLTGALLGLAGASAAVTEWLAAHAPPPEPRLPVTLLSDLPGPLAFEVARRWLAARGAPPAELSRAVLERLVIMACDAASPPRQHFPGGVLVRRRAGWLFVADA
jgi:tRNA(Ile)-lysidine synthetase-like protein